MRDLRLVLTLSAAGFLAGCAGPATRPERIAAAIPVVAPSPLVASVPEPVRVTPGSGELDRLLRVAPGLDAGVLALALEARACAVRNGDVGDDAKLAVIDYSLPSTEKRLWVFDMAHDTLLFHEHVAHGSGTGDNLARRFSNDDGSHATSLGLFRTAETYTGGNGYSLRLDGLDPGFNDHARARAIVMHGAWYVDPGLIRTQGRLGRSQGCPALRQQVASVVIDSLRQRQLLFAYADDAAFLQRGRSFACDGRSARAILADARARTQGGGHAAGAIAAS
ncbi:MAG: murein L,D-transpeptidase catalytic domain family protein [Lysobacteraceae bacterium]|nr:MAG: murein L,D-transpeptidase catalytic domain family protein [Xanthomonadaceae bacterium]